jgi:uncharacterized protein YbaP (TraB family)
MNIPTAKCAGPLFVLALALGLPVLAQQSRPATAARHSLWKVEGKHNTVYLLGSVHVLKAEDYPLAREMEAAYTNAVVVAFEADIDAMQKSDVQTKLLTKARLPGGETLAQQLSPALYARFTNHLEEVGLPPQFVAQFKPSLAALTLVVLQLQKLGLDPQYGLDKHFFDRAKKDKKPTVALETVDFQLHLATDFSKEEGELLMKVTLDDVAKLKTEFRDLLKAWQTGDDAGMETILNEASHQAPVIYKRLLTDRNRAWVPKIQEWLQGDQNVLVVVGAGHLVGSEGVVELLRKKGLNAIQQ